MNFSADSSQWQTQYTREQAHRDSLERAAGFLLPILILLAFAFVYCIFTLRRYFSAVPPSKTWLVTLTLLTVIIFMFAFIAVMKHAFGVAAKFFTQFYAPPAWINSRQLINYRLYGRMKLPEPLNMVSQFKYVLVKDGDIEKKDQWPSWIVRHVGGPILLIVFDGCALYLERGGRFSRVVGPGDKSPFLHWDETIKYVVDLRPKVKVDNFSAWTKDGINITLTVKIECRIGYSSQGDPTTGLVYSYDPIAVKKAIERYALRWPDPQKEPSEFTWVDAAWGQVTGIVPAYIGSRSLDDLLLAERKSGQILAPEALKKLTDDLNKATSVFGVSVAELQIIKVDMPEEVHRLQEEYWKAERESIATILEGQAKAFSIRAQEKARADAQRDIIMAIADGLEKNRNKQFIEPLLLSLSSILDESLEDPLMRAYLAKETIDALEKLQKLLDRPHL